MSDDTKIMPAVSSIPPRTTTVVPAGPGTHAAPGGPAIPQPGPEFLGGSGAPSFQEFAEKFIQAVAPMVEAKAAQYGSNSLAAKGRRYARAQGRTAKDQEALELACMQYCAEKIDRMEDAALHEVPASQDTLVDLTVYGLMFLYVRKYGRWM